MNINITQLNEHDKKYELDIPEYSVNLKQHQFTSLYKCIEMENEGIMSKNNDLYVNVKTKIGILADNVGSGKSYVILALLLANKTPQISFNKINVYGDNTLFIEYKNNYGFELLDLTIIVCSFSLINQWEGYIKKCYSCNAIKYHIVNKSSLLDNFEKNYRSCNLLLVSSTFYGHIVEFLNKSRLKVKRVIFDEADSTGISKSKYVPAMFYWFVTASYKNLLYPYPTYQFLNQGQHYQDYRSHTMVSTGVYKNSFVKKLFVDLIKSLPGLDYKLLLPLIVIKNDDNYVKLSFQLPEKQMYYIECVDVLSNILHGITTNNTIIKAVNAGDLKTAINVLQKDNKGDEEHILNLVKEDLNKDLQNCVCTIQYYESIILQNENQKREKLLQLKREETELKNKIIMLEERIRNNICIICYTSPVKKTITKCCKNTFCFECICKWLQYKTNCPFCRVKINHFDEELMVIHDEQDSDDEINEDGKLSKIETLSKLLEYIKKTYDNEKILIFSAYDGSFENISNVLKKLNFSYGYLFGKGLQRTYEQYRNPDSNLNTLMINSRSFGSGLNLENTTDIILFHNFDQQIENQVIGRAQRPGRNSQLRVWYLFNENEVRQNVSENNINSKTRFILRNV